MALIDITVKTLDGQNRIFSVPEQMTVGSFKEKISNSIEIPADTQRLIFHGRVMQDDKELREYDIHGKAVHVVQRAPPSTTASSTTDSGSTSQNPPPHRHHHHHIHHAHGPGTDGNLLDVQIHFGGMNTQATTRDARQRIQQAEINVGIINDALDLLEQRTGARGSQAPQEETTESSRPDGSGSADDDDGSTTPPESMDTTTQQETSSTTGAGGGSGSQPTSSASTSQPQAGNRESTTRNQNQEGLSASQLADFLDRVLVTSRRMTPHLELYQTYLRDTSSSTQEEGRRSQEVANRVMEAVHAMSHVMHNLSDVMVDMHTPAPRQAIAVPPLPPFAMTGTNTMAIPIHMNIRGRPVATTQPSQSRSSTTTTTTPASAATTTAPNTNAPTGAAPTEEADATQEAAPITVEGIQVGDPIVTVHNIQATVLTDDVDLEEGMHFDTSGQPANAGISIITNQQQNPLGQGGGAPAVSTFSTAPGSTNPAAASSTTSNTTTPTTSSAATRTGSGGNATAGFTVGPTTNVNIGGTTAGGIGPLPNVPGLPSGMLQNIVQSILSNHGGVQSGQPVQVNVVHPGGLGGGIHIQQQPPRQQGPAQARPPQTSSSGTNTANSGTTSGPNNNNTGRPSGNILRPILINRGRPTPYPLGPRQTHPRPSATAGSGGNGNNGSGNPASGPGGAPHHHHHHHHNQRFADQFLPCSSHHYLSQTARRAGRANRSQGQQQRVRRIARAIRSRRRQQVPNLSTMVSGMVGDLIGQVGGHVHQHTAARNNNGGGAGTNRNTTTTSSSSSTATSAGSTTSTNAPPSNQSSTTGIPPPGVFNPMQMLAGLIGGGGGPAGGPQAGGPGGPGGPIHLDLTSLISNMMGGSSMNAPPPSAAPPGNNNNAMGSNSTTTTSTTTAATTSSGGGGGPMGTTLADLFRQFTTQMGSNDDGDQSSPSFVQSLIETVAPHIRLTDLFSLVMGNTRVVGQLRQPLRQFARERVTQLGSVENVVNAAVDDMNSEILFVTSCVEVRPGVNMTQSLRSCLRHHLTKVIEAILSEAPASQDAYGQELFNLWMSMLAQVVALSIYCIRNGEAGFAAMLQQYMPRLTRDLNPAITVWMSTSVQDILSSFHRNHPVPETDILCFVVDSTSTSQQLTSNNENVPATASTTNTPSADKSSATPSKSSPDSTESRTGSAAIADGSADVPMEVTESPSPSSLPPRHKVPRTQQQVKDNNDSSDEFVDAPEEFTSRPQQAPPVAPVSVAATSVASRPSQIATSSASRVAAPGGLRNGAASNTQWQDVIPQEWIPVINQDVDRQKEQRSQPPLSDAYLQGLPAKRRRMMVLEHAGEIGNMPQYLPSAIARAARSAGVEPISSQQNLMQEAAGERELHRDLEQEVQAMVESRITADQDFNSDRFPNSIRYFQKPKKNP